MFKKFTDRITSAAASAGEAVSNIGGNDKVRRLQDMGFSAEEARNALSATNGDVDRAAELLLAQGSSRQQHRPRPARHAAPTTDDSDEQLRRAMEESRQAEEERRVQAAKDASTGATKNTAKTGNGHQRSAAAARAGQAALERAEAANNRYGANKIAKKTAPKKQPAAKAATKPAPPPPPMAVPSQGVRSKSNGLSQHPAVKLPAQLKDKSQEEQILRCADRLAPYPLAVDTLFRALVALRNDPNNSKFRKIDKSTPGYQRTLQGVPGAEGMLHAMNFRNRGSHELVLDRNMVDEALLYLGVSALETAKATEEYSMAKRKIDFAKEVKAIQRGGDDSEAEALKRAAFMAKCPSEPSGGAGALLQLLIADEKVSRRFDGDDVLRDVLNWIGGHGSAIPDKILSRDWCIVDLNRYPIAPIDCEKNSEKTLQYIGCWPSGRLEIRPSSEKWMRGSTSEELMGSSRGLGAAPASTLH